MNRGGSFKFQPQNQTSVSCRESKAQSNFLFMPFMADMDQTEGYIINARIPGHNTN